MNRDDELHDRLSRKWNQREPEEIEEIEEIEEVERPGRRVRDGEDEREAGRSYIRRLPTRDEEDRPRRKKKKKSNKQLRRILLLTLLFGGGLLVIVVVLMLVLRPRDRLGPFKAQMPEYLGGEVRDNAPPNTPLPGKMVVVSNDAKGLDDIHFKIAESARATTPDEVKVVVRVNAMKKQVGQYDNGAPGFQHSCDVLVIDNTTKQVLASRQFVGDMPPKTIRTKSTSAVYGSDVKGDVVSYLNGLRMK